MNLRRRLREEPSLALLGVSAVGVLAGLGMIMLGWAGASRQLFVTLEVPWLVSGGLGGLALMGLSATLLAIHLRRRAIATELVLLDKATALATELAQLRRVELAR